MKPSRHRSSSRKESPSSGELAAGETLGRMRHASIKEADRTSSRSGSGWATPVVVARRASSALANPNKKCREADLLEGRVAEGSRAVLFNSSLDEKRPARADRHPTKEKTF